MLGQVLWEACFLQAPDERLRIEFHSLLAGSRRRKHLAEMFRLSGHGVVPAECVPAQAQLARISARDWLSALMAAYCAWVIWRDNPTVNRGSIRDQIQKNIESEDIDGSAGVLFSNLSKLAALSVKNTKEMEIPVAAPIHRGAVNSNSNNNNNNNNNQGSRPPNNNNNNNSQVARNATGRPVHPPVPVVRPRTTSAASGSCFFCGVQGHRQDQCEVYAAAASAAGGRK